MKLSVYPTFVLSKKFVSFFLLIVISITGFSQIQLSFTGAPVVTGTPGAVGTKYTYANVGTTGAVTIKAEINIISISGGASINLFDATGSGSDNAWQPVINGSLGAGSCWGIEFLINFFDAATGLPLTLSSFKASGVDIDGDNLFLQEYNTFYSPSFSVVETPTALTITNTAGKFKFLGTTTGYPGIALSQTNVAVSCLYNNRSSIQLELGACCTSGGACAASGSGNRQHSINFFDPIPFVNGSTLSVKLISFSASKVSSGTLITWKSAEELNLSHYILQYSDDGTNFIDFATINATGSNGFYSYTDNNRRNLPIIFYRLKSIDINGRFTFSGILRIKNDINPENKIIISPNPVQNDFSIAIQSSSNQVVEFRLINIDGRIVNSIRRHVVRGSNLFFIADNLVLPNGIYYLTAVSSEGIIGQAKIIKN